MRTGTRQKLSILLALVGNPSLIVLDEAFNGLDPASGLAVKNHLRARLEQRGVALQRAELRDQFGRSNEIVMYDRDR